MRKNHKQVIGKWGEALAVDRLMALGYEIIGRNIRTPYGEIDLIAKDGNTVVFIEVKTRTVASFGHPEEAVTKQKLAHLQDSVLSYMQEHIEITGDWRIDVIAIEGNPISPNPKVTWFENVLS